ncbi:BREX system P-loop protein BrxC [Leptospira levettii]|uniref:BREX system P-loop protein BrxC n=1 Tax=Leptospira levettii TaxID=2023178 RepID=UPI003EBF3E94
MTAIKNQDIFQKNPTEYELVNNGVTKVNDKIDLVGEKTLKFELQTFVCEGQYESGLTTILENFISHIGREQKAAWVSGFFGSGKSHLVKMLRFLWTNEKLSTGETPRLLAQLPESVSNAFIELQNRAKPYGPLRGISGTLGSQATGSVRLALLHLVYQSLGLPTNHSQAKFVLYLKRKNLYDLFCQKIKESGSDVDTEIGNFYVSTEVAKALIAIDPDFAKDVKTAKDFIKSTYPLVSDIDNLELETTLKEVLSVDGKFPLTLIVLDEMQLFIGDDSAKSTAVQELAELLCSKFEGKICLVGTGQYALSQTPMLGRLMARYSINIPLSDNDIQSVLRKTILAKKENAVSDLKQVGLTNSGELSRHLQGSQFSYKTEDQDWFAADYPILSVRRRFWLECLKLMDKTGTQSQLRSQLNIIYNATKESLPYPIGRVTSGDFLFGEIQTLLLQTAVLPKETNEAIGNYAKGDGTSQLKGRILALVFLIEQCSSNESLQINPTPDTISDLLVTDLSAGSATLRRQVPELLKELEEEGKVFEIKERVYRTQTKEGQSWHSEYRAQKARFSSALQTINDERTGLFKQKLQENIRLLQPKQGQTKEPREFELIYQQSLPPKYSEQTLVIANDGWNMDLKAFQSDVKTSLPVAPNIYIFLKKDESDSLRSNLIEKLAIRTTLNNKGTPHTVEGKQAKQAMETKLDLVSQEITKSIEDCIQNSLVYLSGGSEVYGTLFREKLTGAMSSCLDRLYPKFEVGDSIGWGKAIELFKKGDGDLLKKCVGFSGDASSHPACSQILGKVVSTMTGKDVEDIFKGPPYGWGKDTIVGATLALVTSGDFKISDNTGKPIDRTKMEIRQFTGLRIEREGATGLTTDQKLQLKGFAQVLGVATTSNDMERILNDAIQTLISLANEIVAVPPFPTKDSISLESGLLAKTGNEFLQLCHASLSDLKKLAEDRLTKRELFQKRKEEWNLLIEFLQHAKGLSQYEEWLERKTNIESNRLALHDPNPIQPLLVEIRSSLEKELSQLKTNYLEKKAILQDILSKNPDWISLPNSEKDTLLRSADLFVDPDYQSTTPEELRRSLLSMSLSHWKDKILSLPSRFATLETELAKKKEPKSHEVSLPKGTLRTEEDVKAWVNQTMLLLLQKIKEGPVILS